MRVTLCIKAEWRTCVTDPLQALLSAAGRTTSIDDRLQQLLQQKRCITTGVLASTD
jgi:hypothetical protein